MKKKDLFKIISGILHLGNIKFENKNEASWDLGYSDLNSEKSIDNFSKVKAIFKKLY